MKYNRVHDFNLTITEMEQQQRELKELVTIKPFINNPSVVCGVDVSYHNNLAIAVIVALSYEDLSELEVVFEVCEVKQEYIPGFLAFRELPLFLKAWKKLTIDPDIVFFDGNGILHPQRMGIATHASFFINKPTIGIGKTPFIGHYKDPDYNKGAFEYIYDNEEIIGVVLRTRKDVKPVFVSIGNKVTLQQAIEFTMRFANDESRIPLVTKVADSYSRLFRKSILQM